MNSQALARKFVKNDDLVGLSGLEPPTSRLSGARSNQLSYKPMLKRDRSWCPRPPPLGGDDGIRTHDPLLAGQVLSQLSYTPVVSYPTILLRKLPQN